MEHVRGETAKLLLRTLNVWSSCLSRQAVLNLLQIDDIEHAVQALGEFAVFLASELFTSGAQQAKFLADAIPDESVIFYALRT